MLGVGVDFTIPFKTISKFASRVLCQDQEVHYCTVDSDFHKQQATFDISVEGMIIFLGFCYPICCFLL